MNIYILSDGETWSSEGELRQATKDDVENWSEYDLIEGQSIFCVGDDFEISDDMTVLQITDDELEELQDGSHPRHLDNYYDRLVKMKPI
jgi:hypothetical protein